MHQDLNIKKYLTVHSGISTCTFHYIQVIVGNYLSISINDISYQVLNISEFRIRMGSGLNWISGPGFRKYCDFQTVVIKNLGLDSNSDPNPDWTQILDWTSNFIGVEISGTADGQVQKVG